MASAEEPVGPNRLIWTLVDGWTDDQPVLFSLQVFSAVLADVKHFTTLLRSVAFQQVRHDLLFGVYLG